MKRRELPPFACVRIVLTALAGFLFRGFHMTTTQRNVLANFAGQAAAILLGLVFLPLYLPLLGTEAYGLVGFYTALIAVFGLLDAGLGAAASRETARRAALAAQAGSLGGLLRTLEWIYWTSAAGAAVLCWVASPWLATHWLHLERLPLETATNCLRLLGLGLACRLPGGLYAGVLNGLHRQVSQNVLRIALALLGAPGSLLLLKYVSRAPETFFAWQLALAALSVGIVALLAWHTLSSLTGPSEGQAKAKPSFARAELRSVARFATGNAAIGVLSLVLVQTDRFLLSAMLPLASLGVYTLAQNLNGYFASAMGNVTTALQPRFYELEVRGERAATVQLLRRATAAVGLLLLPAAGFLITRMDDLLGLWLRNPALAAAAAEPARWLVAGSVLNNYCILPCLLLLARGNTRFGVVQNIVAITIQVPLLYCLIRIYGITGGGMGWLALNAGYYLISNQFIFRSTLPEEKNRWLVIDTGLPLVICTVIFAPAAALGWPAHDASLSTKLVTGVATAVIAAATLVACSLELRANAFALWQRATIHR